MKNLEYSLDGCMNALNFISRSFRSYSSLDGVLNEASANDGDVIFFSRSFLRERHWSIIPLWESSLTTLMLEDGRLIEFMNLIRNHCLEENCRYMQYATIDKMKEWWYPDFSSFAIASKKIDLSVDDPNQFFSIREPGHMPPYQGNNIFWPESESFALYTDGDNLAFMVGDRGKIEKLIGVSYQYCLSRFVAANTVHLTRPELLRAFKSFCEEHFQ